MPRARTGLMGPAVLAAILIAAAAAVLAVALGAGRRDELPGAARAAGKQRYEQFWLRNGLGAAVAVGSDLWVDDRANERLVRVRVPEGSEVSHLGVRGRLALAAGADGIWALQAGRRFAYSLTGPLLHVDPRSGRVRARIALRAPSGKAVLGSSLLVSGGHVWIWGPRDILRVDPRTDRVVQWIRIPVHDGVLTALAFRAPWLVAGRTDGTFIRVDARTGRFAGAVRTRLRDPRIRSVAGSRLIVTSGGTLAAVDLGTGRVAWRRHLGFRAGSVARAHGLYWVRSAAVDDPGDRLSSFDPRTGKLLSSRVLPTSGTTTLVTAGTRLVVPSPVGRILVVTPLVT